MYKVKDLISANDIQNRIFYLNDTHVMIDRDLAELYQVETKVLNQSVKRNIERFPDNFRFQLSTVQKNELVTNCDRFKNLKHSSANPFAFTEQGVAMLSAVLRSDTAIKVSIQIINAFVEMRKFIINYDSIFQRLSKVEFKQMEADNKINQILKIIEKNNVKPKQGIFFDGQIFDAYKFISGLIKDAKNSIILIDNYVDESVLTLFSKNQNINVYIYTKNIHKQLKLDLKKYNSQYKPIKIKRLKNSHDRFLIIDKSDVYHFGASLKDLGKKWFAFSRFDIDAISILERLENI